MEALKIPNSIENIYDFFHEIKSCPVKKMNPVPISALNDNLFFNKEDVKTHMTFLWEVVETEEYFIWIIQSDKWDRKTWRNHFINKLQSNLAISILVFFPSEIDENQTLEQFSMSIITMDGTLDFPFVIPEKPEESVLKIWEAIKSDTLNDILEFESQVACEKYRVTAENLYNALQTKDIDGIIEIFNRAGHETQDGYVLPKEDTILENAILHIMDSNTNPKQVMKDYYNLDGNDSGEEAKWIISLTPESLIYFKKNQKIIEISLAFPKSKKKTKKDKEISERILNYLASLVALISRRAAYNAETFAFQYGEYSLLHFYTIQSLKKLFEERKDEIINVIFQEWQRRFEAVYKKGDATEELFLKHTYLGLLIRLVLYVVYFPKQKLKTQSIIEMTTWLEERGSSLFTNDFFAWGLENIELLEFLYFGLRPLEDQIDNDKEKITRIFEADDLFRTIYQQMVSPVTRHALGEFYTPPPLARMMIENSYKFGQVVLDPACGSGTFLVEIIRKIRASSDKTINEQLIALKNVYGFDVNPIAVATSKANVLLHLKDFLEDYQDLRTNVFLCNSLFPLEMIEFEDLIYGKSFEFKLITINDSIHLSLEFFNHKYQKKFGDLLSKLDALMTKVPHNQKEFEKILKDTLAEDMFSWLNEPIGSQDKTLRDNFWAIAIKFYSLSMNEKDHIWTFLLHQSLGTYIIKGKADLVIGNPPWLVLNGIYSNTYKTQVKNLAKTLNITPGAQSISHLEMSALFLYMSKQFLKESGKVFFVVSNAFSAGDNHSGTRQFIEFEKIEIWRFTKDIFKIHNICLSCIYNPTITRKIEDYKNLNVLTTYFKPILRKNGRITFTKIKDELVNPFDVVPKDKNSFSVKKLIPKHEIDLLLPKGYNAYEKLCFAGAILMPRNLINIKIDKETEDYLEISHRIENPKKPWDFDPKVELGLKKVKIEKKFIFKSFKSTGLIPFIPLKKNLLFLPIENDDKSGGYKLTKDKDSLGIDYFRKLNLLFQKKQKKGASITNLWNQINFRNNLILARQKKPFKVVMMQHGSLVKGVIIKDSNVIIDYTNYLIGLDSENESYYLLGYLNSPSIAISVQIIQSEGAGGGGRDIQKRPFLFNFPKYDPTNQLHKKIVNKAKEMEKKAKKIVNEWIKAEKLKLLKKPDEIRDISMITDDEVIKPMTLQNRVYKELGLETKNWIINGDYAELNELVKENIFKNYKKSDSKTNKKGLDKFLGAN